MEKIYSRSRIRLPKIKGFKINDKRKSRAFELTCIFVIAIFSLCVVINAISPIIDKVCEDVAITKATIVANRVATDVMKDYTYNDLINIYKDNNGNVAMMQSNIVTVNEIISKITEKIQNDLIDDDESTATVKLRKFYWNKVFGRNGAKGSC